MNEHSKLSVKKILDTVDLPNDLFLGIPTLSFEGNQELYISNHRGLLAFTTEEIIVLSKDYQIQIKGRGLNILTYSKDELIIKGYVSSLEFV